MDQIKIIQWNAEGILCNRHVLTKFLLENKIHIAIISETWLRPEQHFNIKGYNIERNDSGNTRNGVAIIIDNSLSYKKIPTYSDNSLQNLCIRTSINNKNISIASFYCPTVCTPRFNKNKFSTIIENIPKPMIVGGDFNAHHTIWGCGAISSRGRDLLDAIDDNNLVVLNSGQVTTVGSHIRRPNGLDLSFVSPTIAMSCDWSVHNDPLGSYHLPVLITLNSARQNKQFSHYYTPAKFPNYRNVDWKKYQTIADELLQNFHVDTFFPIESYKMFFTILNEAIQKSSPSSRISQKNYVTKCRSSTRTNLKKSLPWWNNKCSLAMEKSKQAYIIFKTNPTEENYIEFKKLQAFKKLTIKNERSNSWAILCESFNRQTPLPVIWKYMKKFNKTYTSKEFDDDSWIPMFLKKYTPDTTQNIYLNNTLQNNTSNKFLTESFLLPELISAVNSRKDTAFGLDGVPYKMIKYLNNKCLQLFLNIFNLLWSSNTIPSEWKTDCLVPIPKPDKVKYNADSYRPIALTSCIGKIFEQLLKQRFVYYIEHYNILPSNQFSFRVGRSAQESICKLHLDIQRSISNNHVMMCVFFDIVGAYNNVNVDILCRELAVIGFPEKTIDWIHRFLNERKVFVKYNNDLYGPRYSYKGICQGGILSPILFLLYVHKLNIILGSDVKNLQYADDLVVYISGINKKTVSDKLNLALKKLKAYFDYLNLDINVNKTRVVAFGKNRMHPMPVVYNDQHLPFQTDVKFLGVTFSNNLSWKKYVDCIIYKALKAYNILQTLVKPYWGSDPKILSMLYKSLVRSHFEYGYICFASNKTLSRKLEVIQNKCLRLITGAFKSTPIHCMQKECNIPPLDIRFNYLKKRFILKLYVQNNNLLFSDISHSQFFAPNVLYILHDYSQFIKNLKDLNIYRNDKWPCYCGPFESKYTDMAVYIDNEICTKEQAYENFCKWPEYQFVYTDGAKHQNSVSSAMYDCKLKIGLCSKIDNNASIFSAEASAIIIALHHIERFRHQCSKWAIVSDSMSVLNSLKNDKISAKTNYIVHDIKQTWYDLQSLGTDIIFIWTPAHKGVVGNENADFLAKYAIAASADSDRHDSSQTMESDVDKWDVAIPYTDIISLFKEEMIEDCKRYYYSNVNNGKGLWYDTLKNNKRTPWFAKGHIYFNRKYYTTICRLRFGHYKLNAHLYKLKIVVSPECRWCHNEEETLQHIFFTCSTFGIQRLLLMDELLTIYKDVNDIPRDVQHLLNNENTYIPLYKFICGTIQGI